MAINKVDKPEADVERTKQGLLELNLVPEEWGGGGHALLAWLQCTCAAVCCWQSAMQWLAPLLADYQHMHCAL